MVFGPMSTRIALLVVVLSATFAGTLAASSQINIAGFEFVLPGRVPYLPWDAWSLDALLFSLAVSYVLNIFLGWRSNTQIALQWADALSEPEGVLRRNFASVGPQSPKDELAPSGLVRLSGSEFCVPASGRRGLVRFEAVAYLRKRQDLFGYIMGAVSGGRDEIELRAYLRPGVAPPTTFVLGVSRLVKGLLLQEEDVKAYAKSVPVDAGKLPGFPAGKKLTAAAEAAPVLYDIVKRAVQATAAANDAAGSGANDAKAVWALLASSLRYLHVTDAFPRGDERGVVLVVLSLPASIDQGREALLTGTRLALALADAAADAKLPADALRRAEAARRAAPVAGAKDATEAREKALQDAREKKAAAERERLARLTPAARAKEIERKERIEKKRSLKAMTRRA